MRKGRREMKVRGSEVRRQQIAGLEKTTWRHHLAAAHGSVRPPSSLVHNDFLERPCFALLRIRK